MGRRHDVGGRSPLRRVSAGLEVLLLVAGTFILAEHTGPLFEGWFGGATAWGRALVATCVHVLNAGVFVCARLVVGRPDWGLRAFGIRGNLALDLGDAAGLMALKLAVIAALFGAAMWFAPEVVRPLQRQLHAQRWSELLPQVVLRAPLRNALSEEVRYHVVGQGLFMDRCGTAWGLIAGIAWFGTGHGLLRGLLLLPVTVLSAAWYNRTRRIVPLFIAHWLNDVIGATGLRLWSVGLVFVLGYGVLCLVLVGIAREHVKRVLWQAWLGLRDAWEHRRELLDGWSLAGLGALLVGYHALVAWLY